MTITPFLMSLAQLLRSILELQATERKSLHKQECRIRTELSLGWLSSIAALNIPFKSKRYRTSRPPINTTLHNKTSSVPVFRPRPERPWWNHNRTSVLVENIADDQLLPCLIRRQSEHLGDLRYQSRYERCRFHDVTRPAVPKTPAVLNQLQWSAILLLGYVTVIDSVLLHRVCPAARSLADSIGVSLVAIPLRSASVDRIAVGVHFQ